MSDSRIERDPEFERRMLVAGGQKYGLLVVDPTDPAVIDRVARELVNQAFDRATKWDQLDDDNVENARDVARAVIAALGGDQPEPVSLSVQRRLDVMRGDQR